MTGNWSFSAVLNQSFSSKYTELEMVYVSNLFEVDETKYVY